LSGVQQSKIIKQPAAGHIVNTTLTLGRSFKGSHSSNELNICMTEESPTLSVAVTATYITAGILNI
jgi:hypothetical protein